MMIVVYILLFILCLSVLIMIHELGHLAMAKAFNVYCFEYSIGMGPALFRKKRKNGETYFAIRAFPFGGFVSMYGEANNEELPDGIDSIPEERALNKIKRWKRAIVLLAGVTMNAFLAIVLFFVSSAMPQKNFYIDSFVVAPDSVAYNAGIKTTDYLAFMKPFDETDKNDPIIVAQGEGYYVISMDSVATYNDSQTKTVAALLDTTKLSFKNIVLDNSLFYYEVEDNKILLTKPVDASQSTLKSITLKAKFVDGTSYNEETKKYEIIHDYELLINRKDETSLEPLGLTFVINTYHNNFGGMVKQTFSEFGESSILIFKAIGNLFVGKGWNDVGGIVSIYTQTTTVLTDYGISPFIRVWGIISVNLAIMNLLPFPGLDGWQLLVLIIEATAHKEIPQKVKSIVSVVGLVLLFAFMIAILVKDIIGLF